MGWWVADLLEQNPAMLISWVVWVIASIVLHELAHGWAAIRLGDRTPIESGHMTWSPLVHMGPMSLLAFALVGIAWGMMPINPRRLRRSTDEALVAVAGPAMNLALALGAIVLGAVWLVYFTGVGSPLHGNFLTFFYAGAMLNLVLMVFNLLPAPPLDGYRILSTLVPGVRRMFETQQGQFIGLGIFLLAFFYGGRFLFGFAGDVANAGIGAIAGFLPAPAAGAPPAP